MTSVQNELFTLGSIFERVEIFVSIKSPFTEVLVMTGQ